MKPHFAFAALAALAPHAAAQQPAAKPHPADPAAPAPAVKYESALAGYRGFREEPLAPWRGVNEDVARAGGHLGIFGGAGQPGHAHPGATSKPAAPAMQPVPGPHLKQGKQP